jgi:ribulose-5-phosphate 4-epimerase/fuculose-1-phosphate aldolase
MIGMQCLMLRHPENPAHFLMAEWGIWFEEVTASNLLRYNHVTGTLVTLSTTSNGQTDQRRLVEMPAEPGRSNTGCIPVAAAIFAGRPDVNIVVHVHPFAVQAVGGLVRYPPPPL